MPISLLIILPFVTMLLGFSLVLFIIRGKRKSVLIGVHVLFGLATLEMVVIMLKGWPIGDAVPAGEFGDIAAEPWHLQPFSACLGRFSDAARPLNPMPCWWPMEAPDLRVFYCASPGSPNL